MATDAKKMIALIRERAYYGVPGHAPGICAVRDENGTEVMKLGFDAHRDIVGAIGYEAAKDVRADLCAALAAACGLAEGKAVAAVYGISPQDVERELSDDGHLDPENLDAAELAVNMLKKAVSVYAGLYVSKKLEGEEWHGNL